MKNLVILLSMAAVALMAGCGGSSSGSPDPTPNIGAEEDPLRTYSVPSGDIKDVFLVEGVPLHARRVGSAAVLLSYPSDRNPDDGTTALTEADVSISRNDVDEFTLVVNGVSHRFEMADRVEDSADRVAGSGYEVEDVDGELRFYNLVIYTDGIDSIDRYLDPVVDSGYAAVFGYRSNIILEDGPDILGYAVIGTETADAYVGSLGDVTYSGGSARLDLFPEEFFVTERGGESVTSFRFDRVTMTVNFDSTEISGIMDGVSVRLPSDAEYTGIEGAVLMDTAAFDVNAFGGTLTPDDTFLVNAPNLDVDGAALYSGAFYGGEGEEVAGTLSVTGTVDGSGVNGIGYFTAGGP